ncbi:MAG: ABC transporter permease [Acidobacteriaceae bacterium]
MQTIVQDLRYTLRQLRRSPGFTLTALLTLALGIGATTAMYSTVRTTLLEPLPYPHSEQLVGVGFSRLGDSPNNFQTGATSDLIIAQASSFSSMGIADRRSLGANFSATGADAQVVQALRVSSTYLSTLGVSPILGHGFTHAEDIVGAAPTVLLSEGLWKQSFNADPHILGKAVHIDGDPFTVIGVMPATLAEQDSADLWEPLHLSAADPGYNGTNYQMIARLKTGVSVQQAVAEVSSLTPAIYRKFPWYAQYTPPGVPLEQEFLWPLQQIIVSGARSSLLALSFAVLAVLLMACLNLAGLLTARSIARGTEIALRTALGASRAAILRLLLAESFVLALAGSFLGIVFARAVIPILVNASPVPLPQTHFAPMNLSVAIFAVLLGCATAILFGLIPAFIVFRQSVGTHIGTTRTAGDTAPQQRLGRSLIVAQIALATMLLSTGALLLSSFLNMRSIPSGVRQEHLYALQVNLKDDAYASAAHSQQFISAVEARLRQIPGVASVATVNGLPLDRGLNDDAGPASHPDQIRNSEIRLVTPGYFHTAGTTVLAGNDITEADNAQTVPVALINELAAKRWFPGRNAIGEYIIAMGKTPRRVIGIAANAHSYSLADAIDPTAYIPFAQADDAEMKMINGWFPTTFLLRAVERPGHPDPNLAAAASAAVNAVDPEISVAKFASMQSFVDRSVEAPRFFSWLAGAFASFALLLTLIGLFGLLSYQVASRTRELGVRMALGAQRSQILTLVLNNGLVLTSIGLVLGVAGSLALRNLIAGLISDTVGVGATTAAALLGNRALAISIAGAAMLVSAVAASLIPAHRASQLEPTEALRTE